MMDQSDVARGSRSFGLAAARDREIACPAKAGQRIAAGRCVDAQEDGCFCPQAYSALRGYEAIVAEDGAGLAGAGSSRGNPAHAERAKQRVRLSTLKARADGFARQDGSKQFAGPGLAAENDRRAQARRGGPSGAPAAAPPPEAGSRLCVFPSCSVEIRADNSTGLCTVHRDRNASRDSRRKPVEARACKGVFASGKTCGRQLYGGNASGLCQFCSRGLAEDNPARAHKRVVRERCSKAGCNLFAVADGKCGPHLASAREYIKEVVAESKAADAKAATPEPGYAQRRKTDDPAGPLPDVGAPTSVGDRPRVAPEVLAERAPPPPEKLVGALQDPIRKSTGVYRAPVPGNTILPAYDSLPLGYVAGLLAYLAKHRAEIDGEAA